MNYDKPDILVWQLCSSYKSLISIAELVMNFISFSKSFQNLYCFINSRFWYFNWLESSL